MIKNVAKDDQSLFNLFQSMQNDIWIVTIVFLLAYSTTFFMIKWLTTYINQLRGVINDDEDDSILADIGASLFQNISSLLLAKVGGQFNLIIIQPINAHTPSLKYK